MRGGGKTKSKKLKQILKGYGNTELEKHNLKHQNAFLTKSL